VLAVIASQAIVQVITKSEEINRVILSSSVDEEFLQRFWLYDLRITPRRTSVERILKAWSYGTVGDSSQAEIQCRQHSLV
jgi:hypothetical protein